MKRKQPNLFIIVLSVIIALSLVITGAISYFGVTANKKSDYFIGDVDATITKIGSPVEKDEYIFYNNYQINNTGKNKCYVYVKVHSNRLFSFEDDATWNLMSQSASDDEFVYLLSCKSALGVDKNISLYNFKADKKISYDVGITTQINSKDFYKIYNIGVSEDTIPLLQFNNLNAVKNNDIAQLFVYKGDAENREEKTQILKYDDSTDSYFSDNLDYVSFDDVLGTTHYDIITYQTPNELTDTNVIVAINVREGTNKGFYLAENQSITDCMETNLSFELYAIQEKNIRVDLSSLEDFETLYNENFGGVQ